MDSTSKAQLLDDAIPLGKTGYQGFNSFYNYRTPRFITLKDNIDHQNGFFKKKKKYVFHALNKR